MSRRQNETESPTVRRVPGFQIPAKKIDCRVIKYSFKTVKGGTFWQEKKIRKQTKEQKSCYNCCQITHVKERRMLYSRYKVLLKI